MKYFVAVADRRSFSAAAVALKVATPSLWKQVKLLEQNIGVPLLVQDDNGRVAGLTAAGQVFLEHARAAMQHAQRAIALARLAAAGASGHLVIAYNPVSEHGIFPHIVGAFRRTWPRVRLTLRALRTHEQLQAFNANELDVGFICPPVGASDLHVHAIQEQQFCAVLPAGHRLAQTPCVSWGDLSNEPLIIYSRQLDSDAWQQIQRGFSGSGGDANIVWELESLHAMVTFASRGDGCCILPEYVSRLRYDDVSYKPLGPPHVLRVLAVAKKKEADILAEAFYHFAIDVCSNQVDTSSQQAHPATTAHPDCALSRHRLHSG